MPKIIISGPTPEFEQAMKKKISLMTDYKVLKSNCLLNLKDCSYEEIKNGECDCFNEEQDEQPGHPEHG